MRIYIIRHGETQSNEKGLLQGWSDDPLNQFGIELAELTGQALKGTQFDIAFSSSLTRAKETANIVLAQSGNNCSVLIDDRVKEINMGDFEGKRFKPGESEVDPALVKAFFEAPIQASAFPNGESVTDVMNRTQDFLKSLASEDYETVLVSTHGCALRCMLNFLYENPADFWHGHVPYNCVVNIVDAVDGQLKLVGDDIIYYDTRLCVDRYAKY